MRLILLILIVLLAIAGSMFLGVALEVVGAVGAFLIILIVYLFRRRKR